MILLQLPFGLMELPQSFNFQNGEPIIIQDDEGMIYTFNADGTYSVVSTLAYSSDYLAATKDYRIDFEVYDEQEFGFDKKEYAAWISNYEVIRLLDSTNYFVAYKSLAPNQSDYVIASIKSENQLSGLSFVALENGSERQLTAEEINDTTYKILLDGMSSSCYVYAKDNELRIGKLWVKVLEEISFDVVLVPVNGATLSQIENIENQLNEIYAQANVTFNVTIAENYNSTTGISTLTVNFRTVISVWCHTIQMKCACCVSNILRVIQPIIKTNITYSLYQNFTRPN
ncbi:MAG: hypothetical protein IPM74_11950 [Crocinitomicaceae bacterium]|nr:hypothetical protein [Crocinitomicaceae bacterium]